MKFEPKKVEYTQRYWRAFLFFLLFLSMLICSVCMLAYPFEKQFWAALRHATTRRLNSNRYRCSVAGNCAGQRESDKETTHAVWRHTSLPACVIHGSSFEETTTWYRYSSSLSLKTCSQRWTKDVIIRRGGMVFFSVSTIQIISIQICGPRAAIFDKIRL